MKIFTDEFVQTVKTEISRQVELGGLVTRRSVFQGLGFTDNTTSLETTLSAAFELGLFPEFKVLRRAGIKPKDYSTTAQVKKGARKVRPSSSQHAARNPVEESSEESFDEEE